MTSTAVVAVDRKPRGRNYTGSVADVVAALVAGGLKDDNLLDWGSDFRETYDEDCL